MKLKHLLFKISGFLFFAAQAFGSSETYCCPPCDDGLNIDFAASYLYWSVQTDHLGYAIENVVANTEGTPIEAKLKTHRPKWDSGWRLEAGLGSACTPVDVRFTWTHLDTTSKNSVRSDAGPTIAITPIIVPFLAEGARSRWNSHLNEYALDFGYVGFCESCLNFQPYVGVFGATVRQKQKIQYDGIAIIGGPSFDVSLSRTTRFWGVGPRLGARVNWKFWNNVSLISNANAALVVGKFKISNSTSIPTDLDLPTFFDVDLKTHRARPVVSGLIGLEWADEFFGCTALTLSVAYEFQYWWNLWNSSSNFVSDLSGGDGLWGDLCLHGLVVTAGLSF